MKLFENLSHAEENMLLALPAYISLLAANADGKMDAAEKKEAIHFTHIQTFSGDPLLMDFFKEAEKEFLKNIELIDKQLPTEKKEREQVIQKEISKLEVELNKLEKNYISAMHISMKAYIEHVSKAHNTVLESFLIPLKIKGLND